MNNSASLTKEFLEKFKDYGLSLAVAGYVAGFVVTNIFLGAYGIANFDIIHAHYVLAGILFLLFAFTCLYPSYVSWQVFAKSVNVAFKEVTRSLANSFFLNVVAVIAITVPLFVIVSLLTESSIPFGFPLMSIAIYLVNCLFVLFIHFCVGLILKLPEKYKKTLLTEVGKETIEEVEFALNFNIVAIPSMLLFLFLIIVLGYARLIYPVMPQQIGGGEKILVNVTYRTNHEKQTLYMLDRTSNTIIFLTQDCTNNEEHAVEVASDEILSLSPVKSDQQICKYPQPTEIPPVVTPTSPASP